MFTKKKKKKNRLRGSEESVWTGTWVCPGKHCDVSREDGFVPWTKSSHWKLRQECDLCVSFPFQESKKFCVKFETGEWLRINHGTWSTMADKLFKVPEPSICEGDGVHKEHMRSGDNWWVIQGWCQGSKDTGAGAG